MADEPGWINAAEQDGVLALSIGGRWEIEFLRRLSEETQAAMPPAGSMPSGRRMSLDASGLQSLDGSGAWLIYDTVRRCRAEGLDVEVLGVDPIYESLLERAAKAGAVDLPQVRRPIPVLDTFEDFGRGFIGAIEKAVELIAFLGVTMTAVARTLINPWRIHWRATTRHIERTGLDAIPIVGLLTFLIGGVIAFIGASQLKRFGAEILTVNLIGITVLRELGVLITAILIAGRSGSAFTAQIGTMKVNEEIDAMETIGIDPIDALVLPRITALVISLPLLTFYADMMGLAGGAVAALLMLDISISQFLDQLENAIDLTTFLVGVLKAPFFAYVIAMVGCFEGLQVTGSAESVGQRTTMSVVEGIFLVILINALVAMTLSWLDI
jgi:phospholipid/cholesterol/gamma-HCH transport system permease protein